jgi:hypothetical protein
MADFKLPDGAIAGRHTVKNQALGPNPGPSGCATGPVVPETVEPFRIQANKYATAILCASWLYTHY